MTSGASITRPAPELRLLAARVLEVCGTSEANAAIVADALIAAEFDGIASHGLSRLPFYADQVASGKLAGRAQAEVRRAARAVVHVDARDGFAFPAIAAGMAAAIPLARELGIVAIGIGNSHHCGVLGHHVERVAEHGLIGLGFANTPAGIAPWGGPRALFGTNPIAFACPSRGAPVVIDQSLSVVARGKIMLAAESGESIPEGWALDAAGNSTTDPRAALSGTMLPIGGAKGAALALMVELLAAALTNSHFGFEASSFFDAAGPPPRVGQLFLVLDTASFGGDAVLDRITTLIEAMQAEPGVRVPGARRRRLRDHLAATGITLRRELLAELERRAAGGA